MLLSLLGWNLWVPFHLLWGTVARLLICPILSNFKTCYWLICCDDSIWICRVLYSTFLGLLSISCISCISKISGTVVLTHKLFSPMSIKIRSPPVAAHEVVEDASDKNPDEVENGSGEQRGEDLLADEGALHTWYLSQTSQTVFVEKKFVMWRKFSIWQIVMWRSFSTWQIFSWRYVSTW